jgi:hypothetical protein
MNIETFNQSEKIITNTNLNDNDDPSELEFCQDNTIVSNGTSGNLNEYVLIINMIYLLSLIECLLLIFITKELNLIRLFLF